MAIFVYCSDPAALVRRIRRAIDSGGVRTWSYDQDGDFTHIGQWKNKAWLRPRLRDGILTLTTIPPRELAITKEVYGVYHGRFIEMLVIHFDTHFTEAEATALATAEDKLR